MSNELKVRAGFDRLLVNERGDSRRYLVTEVEAPPVVQERTRERESLHLALVIDRSGSMGGGRLEAAKQAALGVVERLSAQLDAGWRNRHALDADGHQPVDEQRLAAGLRMGTDYRMDPTRRVLVE